MTGPILQTSNMANFSGRSGNLLLFTNGGRGVVVDSEFGIVVASGQADLLASSSAWTGGEFSDTDAALADSAFATMDATLSASTGRTYMIPKGVQKEAQKALDWMNTYRRGGTDVSVHTAGLLASGGHVEYEQLRHMTKFFTRHANDRFTDEWNPDATGAPSAARVTWGMWGGDVAQRWATSIVSREGEKALTADGVGFPGSADQPDPFYDAHTLEPDQGPEFLARVRLDGSGIDRLYKIDIDGQVYVWDDGIWDNLGHVNGDIYSYDRALDDELDDVEKTHLLIDPSSAIVIGSRLKTDPFTPVHVEDIDADEAQLAVDAIDDEDWELVDQAQGLTAAVAPFDPNDPENGAQARSQRASGQVRDGQGRFAQEGSRVMVGGNPGQTGTITRVNPADATVDVQMESGGSIHVPAKTVQGVDAYTATIPGKPVAIPRVDMSGVLAEPRTPINKPAAQIPGTLPAMTTQDLHNMLYDWNAWVKAQRDAFKPAPSMAPVSVQGKNSLDEGAAGRQIEKETGVNLIKDAYDHPLIAAWLRRTNADGTQPNSLWYRPQFSITAAAATEMTPETSDVQPVYMAVVSPDDPQAVTALISLVPASAESNAPMTYVRKNGAWERDPQMLNDLKSATPPPVVPLDQPTLDDVLGQVDTKKQADDQPAAEEQPQPAVDTALAPVTQKSGNGGTPAANPNAAAPAPAPATQMSVDETLMLLWGPREDLMQFALTAAGGPDRSRGNADKLRRYWTHGLGAAKIRWGTPGDWTRCVRHLGKYMGARAKGYCQLRHKDATGIYTSTHAKLTHAHFANVPNYDVTPVEPSIFVTEITDEDLARPLTDFYADEDPEYDNEFRPEPDIEYAMSEVFGDLEENWEDALDDEGKGWSDQPLSLRAAGGLDRNNGGADKLRRYWTVGPGGAKIMWNAPGDWTRCVRHLSKYLGVRAKGYCNLRHHEMTGMYAGDKRNREMSAKIENVFSLSLPSEDMILEKSILRAKVADAKNRMRGITASGNGQHGAEFIIPLLLPLGIESGDSRIIDEAATVLLRNMPITLLWQFKTAQGHDGSVIVGRIDSAEVTPTGVRNARGVFDLGPWGREAERMVRAGMLRGISADMDKFEAQEEVTLAEKENEGDPSVIEAKRVVVNQTRIMAATLVAKPAFQECQIFLLEDLYTVEEGSTVIPDGIYVDDMDPLNAEAIVAAGYIAESIPVAPPKDWFGNPSLSGPTPLTVTDDGRVYGHIASWSTNHIAYSRATPPPRSRSGYRYFTTGVLRTAEGDDVNVGQLTLAGGHAGLEFSAREAVKHYDDTGSAIADVAAGEDQFGIWVSGALRPGTTPEQVRVFRASAPSGDWRPIHGQLELVAVCQVNVPGFPVARSMVAGGQVTALVAAGAATLAQMKSDPISEMAARLEKLEQFTTAELVAKAAPVREKFAAIREERNAELAAKAEALSTRVATLSNGSYVPRSQRQVPAHDDLRARLSEFASSASKTERERKIEQIARQVDPTVVNGDDVVSTPSSKPGSAEKEGDTRPKFSPRTQPRDEDGKFRLILARLKDNIGVSGNQNAMDKIKNVENLDSAGDYKAASESAADLVNTLNRIDTRALDPKSITTLRQSNTQLAKAVANLPLPFKDQSQKVRFSDLPPVLREMMQSLVTRVEEKYGSKKSAEKTKNIKTFMSGGDFFSQSDVSTELNRMLHMLD